LPSPLPTHAVASRAPVAELARRIDWALPALATLVFGIVRLPELVRSPLWYDELFSMGVAGLPLAESLRRAVADHTNPPLFYLLLKGWMALGGDSDQWVRLLPCVLSMLVGAALVWLAREARAGALALTLAVALAAASPLSVDLANEVRAYSLLTLLACLSLAAALRAARQPTRDAFVLLTLLNIALVHAHYFGWFTVGAEGVVAACCWERDAARRMARSALFTLLAFLPWAVAVASHAFANPAPLRNVAWIATPDARAPLWLLRDLTGHSGNAMADVGWLAFALVALAALALARWRDRRRAGTLVLLAAAGFAAPLAVWVAALIGGHSLWVPRYLSGAAAPVALLVAIAVTALPPRRWAAAAVVGLLWAAAAFAALPGRPPAKFDWRRLARRIERSAGSPSEVYALEAFTAAPLKRYLGAGLQLQVVRALDQLPSGDEWLVYRRESFADGASGARLRALGFAIVTSLAAESAGQKIVAVRIRR